jgi:hypothetical protein
LGTLGEANAIGSLFAVDRTEIKVLSKLTGEERDALRSYLDQYEAMENDAIDEGLRSLKEEPTITFEELDRRISEKFGWK